MGNGIAVVAEVLPARPVDPARRLVDAFLSGRNPKTIEAYARDLEDFRVFLGAPDSASAAHELLSRPLGEANALALSYRSHLLERGLAPATVNRRLAALRSLVKLARVLGLVPWSLEVENVESVPYRDTRGPGRAGYRLLLDALDERLDAKAKRDRAVLRLLYDCALRRGEVVSLDLSHVDLEASTLSILGKKRTARERVTLPEPTAAALADWIEARGGEPGPLFTNFDRAGKGSRLTGHSLYRLVRDLGDEQGLRARPHGLRHAAITEALDLTNGNVRAVAKFSRHRDLRVLEVYDDSRRDLAGEVARLVAGNVERSGSGRD